MRSISNRNKKRMRRSIVICWPRHRLEIIDNLFEDLDEITPDDGDGITNWLGSLQTSGSTIGTVATTEQSARSGRNSANTTTLNDLKTTLAAEREKQEAAADRLYRNSEQGAWNSYLTGIQTANTTYLGSVKTSENTYKTASDDADATYRAASITAYTNCHQAIHALDTAFYAAVSDATDPTFTTTAYFTTPGNNTYVAYATSMDESGAKIHLPAANRGKWISGTPGNGIFQYNNSAINREAKVVGWKVTFKDGFTVPGKLPQFLYYQGKPELYSVNITVTGKHTDMDAADKAMKIKINDSKWERPMGFTWHHSGRPGDTTMELVDIRLHSRVAHTGNAAVVRKELQRLANIEKLKKIALPLGAIALVDQLYAISEAKENAAEELPKLINALQCIQNEIGPQNEKNADQVNVIREYVNRYDTSGTSQGFLWGLWNWALGD